MVERAETILREEGKMGKAKVGKEKSKKLGKGKKGVKKRKGKW